jgi:hypothetical protein
MMIITPRDILVLLALATYFILDRRHVQKLCFPRDPDGRVARRRLAALTDAGLIRRHMTLVASSFDVVPAPVYVLTAKGREYLAKEAGDSQYLFKPVDLPHPLHLIHAMAVGALHMTIDAAINAQTVVVMEAWFNEGDIVNAGEHNAAYYYKLRTKFPGEPEIICSPDAGFLLNQDGRRSAFYLELERGDGHHGTGPRQLAERKCPGYAEVARQKIYLKHFPAVGIDEFRVLLVVPDALRRDAVRLAFQKKDAVTLRTDLWRFVALTDMTAEALLYGEICYRCGDGPAERLFAFGTPGFVSPAFTKEISDE